MDNSGIFLMSYGKSEPSTPDGSAPPAYAYDNLSFDPKANVEYQSIRHDTAVDVSVNNIDDATLANTYANATNAAHKDKDIADVIASEDAPAATADGAMGSGGLPAGSPRTSAKHKDSTVGFKLPEDHERKSSIAPSKQEDVPYRGMGKEDLLRHSSKPFWRRLRYICMSVVLIGWLALVITVVALVLVYPQCRDPLHREWWQKGVIYRVYVRSFQDYDGDGVGDLRGLQSRLSYLRDLKVTIISLAPIYMTHSGSDSDMDIIDHTEIQPELGSMKEFIRLVNETHNMGMKIVLDFIPNHTSSEHRWFSESQNSTTADKPKRNYYVWAEGMGLNYGLPPNNWTSVFNGTAWKNDLKRNRYYLHQFRPSQPELNLRSSEVKDELQEILRVWLNRGVDGFYIRDSGYLFEDYDLRNEMLLPNESNPSQYASFNHSYTYGLSEVHDMFARWRSFLDDYGNMTGKYILLYADRKGTTKQIMSYYGHFNREGVDFPLNMFCLELNESSGGKGVAELVRRWMDNLPNGRWPNWLAGTDSSTRLIERLGRKMIRPFLTLIMLMPGTPVVYYGDEIGMRSLPPAINETEVNNGQRNLSMRSPMQWEAKSHGGFCHCTKGEPWMAVNQQYSVVNVETQSSTDDTVYTLFTNLTSLRAEHVSFHYGDYHEAVVDDDVFSFVRDYDGVKGFLVALNFSNKTLTRTFYGKYDTIPQSASVILTTGNDVRHKKGDTVSSSGLELGPFQGVVLTWEFVAKEL